MDGSPDHMHKAWLARHDKTLKRKANGVQQQEV